LSENITSFFKLCSALRLSKKYNFLKDFFNKSKKKTAKNGFFKEKRHL